MSANAEPAIATGGMLKIAPLTDVNTYFGELRRIIDRLPYRTVDDVAAAIVRAYHQGRTVFLFGNGGSAALASHMACDLGKGTAPPGQTAKRLRVLALTDNVPLITAWANDFRYDDIFAEQLRNFVQPGDVAFAISGSGNSPNVMAGLQVARQAGAFTVGLTGHEGGSMKALCDLCLIVPADNMQLIEDLHLCLAHAIFHTVRQSISSGKTMAVARAL